MDWQPIDTAPFDTPIVVVTRGGSVLKAQTAYGIADEGYVWIAVNKDEHPCCWDDGVCWATNSDYEESDPPMWWVPLPVSQR